MLSPSSDQRDDDAQRSLRLCTTGTFGRLQALWNPKLFSTVRLVSNSHKPTLARCFWPDRSHRLTISGSGEGEQIWQPPCHLHAEIAIEIEFNIMMQTIDKNMCANAALDRAQQPFQLQKTALRSMGKICFPARCTMMELAGIGLLA